MIPVIISILAFGAVFLIVRFFQEKLASGYLSYEDSYFFKTETLLSEINVFMPTEKLKSLMALSGLISGIPVFVIASFTPFHAMAPPLFLLFGCAGAFVPNLVLHNMCRKRRLRFSGQIVEILTSLANGLKSGFSFLQALKMTSENIADPAGQELRIAVREVELGVKIEEALSNMAARMQDEDLKFVVAAVKLSLQTGGDLIRILNQISASVIVRRTTDGKIKALTSQGKLQAIIVGSVPFALGVIVYMINPKLMEPLFNTLLGWIMLAAFLALDLFGFFMIRKIVSIKL